jgi:transposase
MAKAKGKKTPPPAPPGRPTKFSRALSNRICTMVAEGHSLVVVCKRLGLAYSTVTRWLRQPEHEEFCTRYAHAREDQAEYLAGEMKEIADNAVDVQKAKLQVDTRKWLTAKYSPKKYGDHVDVELSGSTSHDVWVRLLTEQVAAGRDGDASDDR